MSESTGPLHNIDLRIGAMGAVLLAFALRLYRLGADSLWFDEAGQALAAMAPSIGEMIEVQRTHVMAMPLDYFVTRMASGVLGPTEYALRFPAAVWGVLTIAVVFSFLKYCGHPTAGLAAAILLAFSVTHIRYSQEVRFYASLGFFYLISTYLLFRALDRPSLWKTVIFTIVTSIGVYFHPFVLLSLANGYVYVLITALRNGQRGDLKKSVYVLAAVSVVLVLVFLPAYLYFDGPRRYRGLMDVSNGSSLIGLVARGLDWVFTPTGVMIMLLGIVGVWSMRPGKKPHSMVLTATLAAALIQIPLIIASDWVEGYFFASRQVFHLLPVSMMMAAMGFAALADLTGTDTGSARTIVPRSRRGLALTVLVLGAAVFGLPDYYEWNRSDGREVALQMIEEQAAGSCVLVLPFYEPGLYEFYLTHRFDHPDIVGRLHPVHGTLADAIAACSPGEPVYLATSRKLRDQNQDDISRLGFVVVDLPGRPEAEGAHFLYKLAPGS